MVKVEKEEPIIAYRSVIDIAKKAKFLRVQDGLDVRELAEVLKLHRERIANLEAGTNKADLQDVIRYCDYFGLDYEAFLFDGFVEFQANHLADAAKLLKAIGYNVTK